MRGACLNALRLPRPTPAYVAWIELMVAAVNSDCAFYQGTMESIGGFKEPDFLRAARKTLEIYTGR